MSHANVHMWICDMHPPPRLYVASRSSPSSVLKLVWTHTLVAADFRLEVPDCSVHLILVPPEMMASLD
jgi:hypothetical protein